MGREIYIILAIGALAIIAILVVYARKKEKRPRLSKLATLALILIIAGVVFGDSRIISYSLIGAGVILCIIDIILQIKAKNKEGN